MVSDLNKEKIFQEKLLKYVNLKDIVKLALISKNINQMID